MHYHQIEDSNGDLTGLVPFCSDSCHQEWCQVNQVAYGGWNGSHEGSDYSEYCSNCGVIVSVGSMDESCACQRDNVVVNRFTTESGETCEHGHWIQLPGSQVST